MDIVGWTAVGLGTVTMIPQLITTIRTHDVHGLSYASMLLGIASSSLWLVYGWDPLDLQIVTSSGLRLGTWLALLSYYIYLTNFAHAGGAEVLGDPNPPSEVKPLLPAIKVCF
eukprot:3934001-Rhodomonas_salina.1